MAEKEYQRLTRARSRSAFAVAFMTRSSVWLGKDHLLCVDSNGYTESYKRFYFRDIQAVTIVLTKRRAIWNVVLLVPIAFCLVGLGTSLYSLPRASEGAIATWASVAAFFGLFLLVNSLLGPTCICHLRTAVQNESLPSLNRVPRTRKVLARVRPFIAAAQGELPAEEIPARLRAAISAQESTSPPLKTSAPEPAAADPSDTPPIINHDVNRFS